MIILTTTTDTLQIVLGAAHTANPVDVVASWRDLTATTYVAGRTLAASNGTTAATICPAPAASTQRVVDFLSVFNRDTIAQTATIVFDDNGTPKTLWSGELVSGEYLTYTDAAGWVRSVRSETAAQMAAAIHSATAKTTPVDADELGIWDSVANALKRLTFANLWAWIAGILGTDTGKLAMGGILQTVVTEITADFSTTALIPYDATIPQNTEGDEWGTATITPKSAASTLEIEVNLMGGGSAGGMIIGGLFVDSTAGALQAWSQLNTGGSLIYAMTWRCRIASGSTSARTYKVRIGSNGITVYINRSSLTADMFGAVCVSRIVIREVL